jgi:hypothetical protein
VVFAGECEGGVGCGCGCGSHCVSRRAWDVVGDVLGVVLRVGGVEAMTWEGLYCSESEVAARNLELEPTTCGPS